MGNIFKKYNTNNGLNIHEREQKVESITNIKNISHKIHLTTEYTY